MVNFEDLSPEDQERLLSQARELVDEENTKKHAVAMYALKKKDLTEEYVNLLCSKFKLKSGPEQHSLRQRYVSMVNYLYKLCTDKRYHGNSIKPIATQEEWNIYYDVSNKVKNMMIYCAAPV